MRINADNPVVGDLLAQLEAQLLENGAWIHPNLTFNCKNNNISLSLMGSVGVSPFILKVPQSLLIPVKPLNLTIKDDHFIVNPDKEHLTESQIKIAEIMVAIYNQTNKVAFHRAHSPWMTFREAPELFDEVIKGRSVTASMQAKIDFLHENADHVTEEAFFCGDFTDTRVTLHKGVEDEEVYKLLPLIDYLDHDCRAGGFMMIEENKQDDSLGQDKNDFVLCVKNYQPFLNQARSDCFVSYGFFDALDTLLQYGFIDETVPFIRSVPLNIPVRDCPDLVVKAFPATNKELEIPEQFKDLKPFWPGIVRMEDGGIGITQLVIGLGAAPNALRRVLISVMMTLIGTDAPRKFLVERTLDVERYVYNRNVDFYEDMLRMLKENRNYPESLKQVVHQLASVQLHKLKAYQFNDDFFSDFLKAG